MKRSEARTRIYNGGRVGWGDVRMNTEGTASKIRGVEQEYPVSAKANFNPSLLVNAAIQGLKRKGYSRDVIWDITTEESQEAHESRILSSWGNNGCRIYNDMGHLEIATPSYNNPFDAIAYDKASEIYALVGAKEASLALKKEVFVHKNNVANIAVTEGVRKGKRGAIKTNTYATHGNILTLRAACSDWSRVEKALISWIVTRILFTGAGDVVSGGFVGKEGVKFVISPRAMFVHQKSSLSTTTARGILNTRDQPHAARRYWRLHDIHFEGLRSEYAIFMRDITQALVISAFETGFLDDAPEIEDPVEAFKEIAVDTQDCEWKIMLKTGEMTDAVAILRYYIEAIERMQEDTGREASKWDEIGLKALKRLIAKLESRRIEAFVDGIDWVTKLALLVNYEPKKASEGISISNQFALLEESITYYLGEKGSLKSESLYNPKDSLVFAENELPWVDWDSYTQRVKYALNNAPLETRDFFKDAMMKRYGPEVRSISWSTLAFKDARVLLDEPFMLNQDEIGLEMGGSMNLADCLAVAKGLYPDKVIY